MPNRNGTTLNPLEQQQLLQQLYAQQVQAEQIAAQQRQLDLTSAQIAEQPKIRNEGTLGAYRELFGQESKTIPGVGLAKKRGAKMAFKEVFNLK